MVNAKQRRVGNFAYLKFRDGSKLAENFSWIVAEWPHIVLKDKKKEIAFCRNRHIAFLEKIPKVCPRPHSLQRVLLRHSNITSSQIFKMSHPHSQGIKADGWKIYTADTFRTPNGTKRFRACRFCHDGRWTVSHFPKYRLDILVCSFLQCQRKGVGYECKQCRDAGFACVEYK